MKRFLGCLLVFAFGLSAQAAKFSGDAFSLGVGARPLGMGGAVVAGPFDGTTAYWNPAGMNYLSGRSITAMHAETFGSLLNHDFIGYTMVRSDSSSPIKAVGFYLYYLGGGGIKITQLNQFDRPVVVREESHGDYLFAAAVSGKIKKKIDFGLTAKIIYRDIGTESGYGLTLDAGSILKVNKHVQLGLMVTDITTGFIRYSGNSEILDTAGNVTERTGNSETINPTVKPGLMVEHFYKEFSGRLTGSGDIHFEGRKFSAQYWSGDLSLDTHFGFELGYQEMLFGRIGSDIGRLTAGAGIDVNRITVDFAYLHHSDLGETFRVSAGYQF